MLKGLLAPAVEEVGDVGVLLGLGDLAHGQALGRQVLGDGVLQRLFFQQDGVVKLLAIAREGEEALDGEGAREGVKVLQVQRPRQLARAILAEVVADDRVVGGHFERFAALRRHAERADELVGFAAVVQLRHLFHHAGHRGRLRLHDGAVGRLNAVPAAVAVHRVVAAADGGHPRFAGIIRQVAQQAVQEALGRIGAGVAPVQHRVHRHAFDAGVRRRLQQREQVRDVRMHAAIGQQADEVQHRPGLGGFGEDLRERGMGLELAARDHLVNARQRLDDAAAGAEVEVAHLGVAHLAGREAHRDAHAVQQRPRIVAQQAVPVGGVGQLNGVAGGVAAVAPPVQYQQYRRLGHRGVL